MHTSTTTLDDLLDLVRRQLGVRDVTGASDLQADLGAESIDIQNLMTAVEDCYGIVFEDEELEHLETVGDVYEALRSKRRAALP